jgi:F-type H+-transporting ATPase subunit delta
VIAMQSKRQIARSSREVYRLCLVNGELDEARARQVAQALAASTRRGALPVLSSFLRLVRLDHARRTASVESAVTLDAGQQRDVERRLVAAYGGRLQASFTQNPALIGGLRVRVGSDVYDGSVRARLAALVAEL